MDPFILMWFRLSLLEDVEDFPQIMHGLANTSPTMTMDRLDINRLVGGSGPILHLASI